MLGLPRRVVLATVIGVTCVTPLVAQDKNTVRVPEGLGFADFKGYEGWHVISVSQGAPSAANQSFRLSPAAGLGQAG